MSSTRPSSKRSSNAYTTKSGVASLIGLFAATSRATRLSTYRDAWTSPSRLSAAPPRSGPARTPDPLRVGALDPRRSRSPRRSRPNRTPDRAATTPGAARDPSRDRSRSITQSSVIYPRGDPQSYAVTQVRPERLQTTSGADIGSAPAASPLPAETQAKVLRTLHNTLLPRRVPPERSAPLPHASASLARVLSSASSSICPCGAPTPRPPQRSSSASLCMVSGTSSATEVGWTAYS